MDDKNPLLYREPILGREYWVCEGILENPFEVAERCVSKPTWVLGAPWRPEPWPGMRAPDALTPTELARVEAWVKAALGVRRLLVQPDPTTGVSANNWVQLVGGAEGVARPHVDSAKLCTHAGVLYLHPYPPTIHCGTSFYRLKLGEGRLGGNVCPPEYESISQIPGLKEMEPGQWQEELEVPYRFNRLLVYRSDLVHSATAYFGSAYELASKRMAIVFFWKADG
ncbi:DUF6445 family protein [Nitrospira sp. Kam-Ns4a]